MIDPLEAFLSLLRADPTLSAEITGLDERTGQMRVQLYGTPPGLGPEAFDPATGIPTKSLVVQQAGGIVQYPRKVIGYFYLIAYGQTGIETQQVLSKLYNILYDENGNPRCNLMIGGRWFMYNAHWESLSAPTIEQQSNWPVAYAVVHATFDALRGA